MDQALRGTETSNYDLTFQTKAGKTCHLLVNASTRRDMLGAVIGVVGVAQDMTEVMEKDRAFRTMVAELQQLIKNRDTLR